MNRTHFAVALLTAALVLPVSAEANYPPGEQFDDALTVDITPEGFDALTAVLPSVLPSEIPFPDVHENDDGGTCLFWTCWEYWIDVTNGWVSLDLSDMVLEPKAGYLHLSTTANIQLNSAGDPLYVSLAADVMEIGVLNESCDVYVEPFPVHIATDVWIDIVSGPNGDEFEVTIGDIQWDLGLSGDDLHLDSCFIGDLIDIIQDVGGFVGLDIVAWILDMMEGTIDPIIQDLGAEIETTLEEALAAATIQEQIELGDAVLTIGLAPTDIDIIPEGMRLVMGGYFDAPAAPCVAPYAQPGSYETAGDVPGIAEVPPGVLTPHHLGVFVQDDWVNNGLYTAWYAGLLCYELKEEDGLPINSTLLTLLSRDAFSELWPETATMVIVTRPMTPPVAYPTGAHDLNAEINDLGLDFYADLDHRLTRVIGTNLETPVGIDLAFDGTTGELLIDVALEVDAIEFTVTYNELAPGYDEEIEGAFGGLFETVVEPLIGGLLGDLKFAIPSIEGFGVQALEYSPAGVNEDFLGLFGYVGAVAYTGGCDDGSCSGGCSSGMVQGRMAIVALPILLVLFRRRRSE